MNNSTMPFAQETCFPSILNIKFIPPIVRGIEFDGVATAIIQQIHNKNSVISPSHNAAISAVSNYIRDVGREYGHQYIGGAIGGCIKFYWKSGYELKALSFTPKGQFFLGYACFVGGLNQGAYEFLADNHEYHEIKGISSYGIVEGITSVLMIPVRAHIAVLNGKDFVVNKIGNFLESLAISGLIGIIVKNFYQPSLQFIYDSIDKIGNLFSQEYNGDAIVLSAGEYTLEKTYDEL